MNLLGIFLLKWWQHGIFVRGYLIYLLYMVARIITYVQDFFARYLYAIKYYAGKSQQVQYG